MKSQRRFAPNGVRNKPKSVSGFMGISRLYLPVTTLGCFFKTAKILQETKKSTGGIGDGLFKTIMSYLIDSDKEIKTLLFQILNVFNFDSFFKE